MKRRTSSRAVSCIRFSLTDSARAESRMKMFRLTGYCGTTGMAHRTTSRMQTDTFGTMTISAAIWRVSAARLDYLERLSVTCIYLNPIFESHENHRYNTANYRNVDPLLGTNEDFRVLCEDAKSMAFLLSWTAFSLTPVQTAFILTSSVGMIPLVLGSLQIARIIAGIRSLVTTSMKHGGALIPCRMSLKPIRII